MFSLKLKLYLILYCISKSLINLECLSKIQTHSSQVTSTKSVVDLWSRNFLKQIYVLIIWLYRVWICLQYRRPWLDSWIRKIHWKRDRLPTLVFLGFPCGSAGKESACNEETWVWSLGWEDPLEKGTATHSSILAWRFHGVHEKSMGSQRVRHDWEIFTFTFLFHWVLAEALGTLCEI